MNDPLKRLVDEATPSTTAPFDGVVARARTRRRRRRIGTTVAGIAAVAAVSTGVVWMTDDGAAPTTPSVAVDPTTATSSPTGTPTTPPGPPDWNGKGAPPIFVHTDDGQTRVKPWTYCYGGTCADGMPMAPFATAPDGTVAQFSFPFTDWEFEATFTRMSEADDGCARVLSVPVEHQGGHVYAVPAAGDPGTYRVDVFGRAPQGGDVMASFEWTTTEAGIFPEPFAQVSAHYTGLELGVRDLADVAKATAEVTVTYPDRAPEHFGPIKGSPCAGAVWFTSREQYDDVEPTPPVDFRVVLTLDGVEYVGTARWPRDEIKDNEPSAVLTFEPELPAWTG